MILETCTKSVDKLEKKSARICERKRDVLLIMKKIKTTSNDANMANVEMKSERSQNVNIGYYTNFAINGLEGKTEQSNVRLIGRQIIK